MHVRPFVPGDQTALKAIILGGLREHWGELDPSRNPDLNDIAGSYAGAVFLVAVDGERLVGCGALVPKEKGQGEIVRMSVVADQRRRGIGQAILQALITAAKEQGIKRIVLETTVAWQDARGFYEANGFTVTHYQGGDVYFTLEL